MPKSVVSIQLGQCGNQLGYHVFDRLCEEAVRSQSPAFKSHVFETYFRGYNNEAEEQRALRQQQEQYREQQQLHEHGHGQSWCAPSASSASASSSSSSPPLWLPAMPRARAVLVDMEPKVITATVDAARQTGRWKYAPKRQFARQSGSANNWAFGYNVHGPETHQDVSDLVRKEIECCDQLGGFLLYQSLAGGTGSGVGAYVTEMLRDEFPCDFLVNNVVWPYDSGEVLVQSLNSVLTLAHLLDQGQGENDAAAGADGGVVVFENEHMNALCSTLLGIKRPSFDDINRMIAAHLAAVLLPASAAASPITSSAATSASWSSSASSSSSSSVSTSSSSHAAAAAAAAGFAPIFDISASSSSSAFVSSSSSFTSAVSACLSTSLMSRTFPPSSSNNNSNSNYDYSNGYSAAAAATATAATVAAAAATAAAGAAGDRFTSLSSVVRQVFSHPWFKLSQVRVVPQVPESAQEFEANSWTYVLRHLLHMQMTLPPPPSGPLAARKRTHSRVSSSSSAAAAAAASAGLAARKVDLLMDPEVRVPPESWAAAASSPWSCSSASASKSSSSKSSAPQCVSSSYARGLWPLDFFHGRHSSSAAAVEKRQQQQQRGERKDAGMWITQRATYGMNGGSGSGRGGTNGQGRDRHFYHERDTVGGGEDLENDDEELEEEEDGDEDYLYKVWANKVFRSASGYLVLRGKGARQVLLDDIATSPSSSSSSSSSSTSSSSSADSATAHGHASSTTAAASSAASADASAAAAMRRFQHPGLWAGCTLNPLSAAYYTFPTAASSSSAGGGEFSPPPQPSGRSSRQQRQMVRHDTFNGAEKSGALWTTSQQLLLPLERVLRKAWSMFSAGAYVHHYAKFGVDRQTLVQSFAVLESVALRYASM